jgi:hypothetical protein
MDEIQLAVYNSLEQQPAASVRGTGNGNGKRGNNHGRGGSQKKRAKVQKPMSESQVRKTQNVTNWEFLEHISPEKNPPAPSAPTQPGRPTGSSTKKKSEVARLSGSPIAPMKQDFAEEEPEEEDSEWEMPYVGPEESDAESDDSVSVVANLTVPSSEPAATKRKSREREVEAFAEKPVAEDKAEGSVELAEVAPPKRQHDDYAYIASRRGTVRSKLEDFPHSGHNLENLTGGSESADCRQFKNESELFLNFLDHEVSIENWVRATNWNADRFFATGKTAGAYLGPEEEEEYPLDRGDDMDKRIVYQLPWKKTKYHELLMFLVVEMHVATGEHATAAEYWNCSAEGLWTATCMGLRSGISWNRYRQLQQGPRKGKTISKTHMVDPLQSTLQRTFVKYSDAGNSFAIDESMVPWYGKYCPIKVYIKGKPYKYGMKIWSCCDHGTGYLRFFKIYCGGGDKWEHETDEWMEAWSYAERVVLALTREQPTGKVLYDTEAGCVLEDEGGQVCHWYHGQQQSRH